MSTEHISMITFAHNPSTRVRVILLAAVLSMITAVGYVLIGFNMLPVGDLPTSERPAALIYVAASCYLVGGLLILLHRHSLRIVGAVINALVMLFFFSAYLGRPAVLFSPGGLVIKAAQLLLEGSLMYLIITNERRS